MSNIRNVEWHEGAPEKLEAGMLVEANDTKSPDYRIRLVGDVLPDEATDGGECPPLLDHIKRWAWLIKPQELAWLEDMANKHKARARG
ncbi:hypothetical protein AAER32_21975 [Pseudomonas aeruginosa]|uniref:hypothetical protein n=1 Tax=Pseudomonas aeruginosa TaxID=287 RepID=UPI001CA4C2B1|nr:hypothetical protein [Pseudomonas aeruginosa]MBW6161950.1 hypothetical protein [Pseudomonas aeruginosa]MBX5587516.1 hypothetical protein [Pseudomonas aeruginosa]MDP5565926.1 hypothetical protein [Pseudomonas aeruginosa]MDP5746595.1 hypothetical protein [Pseudomonas aeruginosa]MDP5777971.1 hypothetical protein [Pseudomonas aeruginosa]